MFKHGLIEAFYMAVKKKQTVVLCLTYRFCKWELCCRWGLCLSGLQCSQPSEGQEYFWGGDLHLFRDILLSTYNSFLVTEKQNRNCLQIVHMVSIS